MLQGIPEPAPQCVPYLIVQQEVDGQRRPLKEPGLKVGRHPRLPGKHRLQPQRRGLACHGSAKLLALVVCRLNGLSQRDRGLAVLIANRTRGVQRAVAAHVADRGARGRHLVSHPVQAHPIRLTCLETLQAVRPLQALGTLQALGNLGTLQARQPLRP